MKNPQTFLPWICLTMGVVALVIGLSGDDKFLLPGAVLFGSAIVAVAVGNR